MGVGRAAGAEEAAEGTSLVLEEVAAGRATGSAAGRGAAAGEEVKGAAGSSWVMLARQVGHCGRCQLETEARATLQDSEKLTCRFESSSQGVISSSWKR